MNSEALGGKVLEAGGRIIAVKTSAAPRFTLVIACFWRFKVNAFAISTLTAIPMLWPAVTTSGNGPPAIIGVADPPSSVTTLPTAHPKIPRVWVQEVTAGFERLTTMFE
jgi:hypothetical protein